MMDDNNTPAYHPSRLGPYESDEEDNHHDTVHATTRYRYQSHPHIDDIDPHKMGMLPALAEDYYSDELEKYGWDGILKAVFSGTRDTKQSPLKMLRDFEDTLVRNIYSFIASQAARHVKITIPAALVGRAGENSRLQFNHGRHGANSYSRREIKNDITDVTSSGFDDGFVAFSRCGYVQFPPPENRNVNMLPFIFGSKESLPDDLRCYHSLIERCPYMREEIGKVGYLTVHETYVDTSKAQRREGLHIESPGVFQDVLQDQTSFKPALEHHWGMGVVFCPDRFEGGIFMASSVGNTSEVWDALVDKNHPGIVDRHGGCEYLRPLIGKGTKLKAGELIWMTDCTPHEAIPQVTPGYRKFFRVVSPCITHWYADHNTSNPKVEIPESVTIVKGNKFAK
ncbi:unnamed protein product [Cylindrotheca closterium]|uniref:Uncharacterized protein n=1 Tax=Cylindrotheca closterium TaxID=2856 RepID=A0AAD2JKA5_9STRA|nr:unnamed protein product [Cylindrotheca closterium]